MQNDKTNRIREAVRMRYKKMAADPAGGCGCCSSKTSNAPQRLPIDQLSSALGYSKEETQGVPEGANLGLGCGNPRTIAELKPGETVMDLGSGGGFDCFLAGQQVGDSGRVIGVDMTWEMIHKARQNAKKAGVKNVEFRLGEIEHLPVPDSSIDVIISNCVVNLSPEKSEVFKDAFRVLKPGGRLAISDIVATKPLPPDVRQNLALITGCVGGSALIEDLEQMLCDAGFSEVQILPRPESRNFIREWFPEYKIEDHIASATIKARKPIVTLSV